MRIILTLMSALLLVSCNNSPPENIWQGYVEGRQLNLAPRAIGIITTLNVVEGDRVQAGKLLFAVDAERAQSQLAESNAAKAAAEAQLANLEKGGRPEEITAAAESLKEAQAAFRLAEQTYQRSKNLVAKNIVPVARLDQDRSTLDASRARMTEAQSRLDLIRLPARPDVILAARREVELRSAAIISTMAELRDRSIIAPVDGRIETVYRRPGEIAGPSQPVLALLPNNQKRIRFFVTEPKLPLIRHGGLVNINCDNCQNGLQGRIVFISDQAEFTPPIIFTEKERAKLVYLIEAQPDQPDQFHNGQPVSVSLP